TTTPRIVSTMRHGACGVGFLAGVVAAVFAAKIAPASAAQVLLTKTCPPEFVHADLRWGEKCLHDGELCKVGNLEYHAYRCHCRASGRLTDYVPQGSTTAPTSSPPAPASPPTTTTTAAAPTTKTTTEAAPTPLPRCRAASITGGLAPGAARMR